MMKTIDLKGNTAVERNEWLRSLLTEHVCSVTFNKVNGEVRTMPCTLRQDLVPKYERKKPVVESEETIKVKETSPTHSVWCTDKAAWRSIRVESETELKINFSIPTVV
jgi:hypothetical protein